ncbi:MAG TPA: helix-turn-helix transcriptional regulator [Pirellulales bacterium]|nr:helix-turn-helix transcriptional regulator [Pirellulales bacterium]
MNHPFPESSPHPRRKATVAVGSAANLRRPLPERQSSCPMADKLRGMTQAGLANAIGVASNTMAILQRGERAFSLKLLNALGAALDVPAACLAIVGSPSAGTRNPAASQVLAKLQSLISATIRVGTILKSF